MTTSPATIQRPDAAPAVNRHRFSVAPMMDCTDRHYRYLARLVSRRALLYTEMLTTGAVMFGDAGRLLEFDPAEHPLVLQIGGSDPAAMARSARIAERWGYDEININVGCPSDRVQAGAFGACLMKSPALVADCVRAMRDAATLPVTVKHRIGVDDQDSRDALMRFVETVAGGGCDTFIVHARKAWLQGLSPRQNREVPPLRYDVVHQVKASFPELTIVINGGFQDLETVRRQLGAVDGVMLGRAAYANPYLLAGVDALLYGDEAAAPSRSEVLQRYMDYCEQQLARGVPLSRLTRHVIGLFQGCRGARAWRRHISEHAHRAGAGVEVLAQAGSRVADPDA
ncbi:MAG TPA: tRNA dihydrouridine(20/20a) synthase DusA [Arenicellales bacterium]|nr:tRNA dihydrouridine(20/20a) synthase DusA [Arenicellales bacterium]